MDPGLCDDEMASAVFPDLMISYKVCTYRMQAGTGAGVAGFPNGGLATNLLDGAAFSFGEDLVIAFGATYDLCWCNGTETSCISEADFSVRIGPLHFSGPTVQQSEREIRCIAGMPCHIPNFQGQAIEEGACTRHFSISLRCACRSLAEVLQVLALWCCLTIPPAADGSGPAWLIRQASGCFRS